MHVIPDQLEETPQLTHQSIVLVLWWCKWKFSVGGEDEYMVRTTSEREDEYMVRTTSEREDEYMLELRVIKRSG